MTSHYHHPTLPITTSTTSPHITSLHINVCTYTGAVFPTGGIGGRLRRHSAEAYKGCPEDATQRGAKKTAPKKKKKKTRIVFFFLLDRGFFAPPSISPT